MLFVGVAAVRKGLHFALDAWLRSPASRDGEFLVAGDVLPAYGELLSRAARAPERARPRSPRRRGRADARERHPGPAEHRGRLRARLHGGDRIRLRPARLRRVHRSLPTHGELARPSGRRRGASSRGTSTCSIPIAACSPGSGRAVWQPRRRSPGPSPASSSWPRIAASSMLARNPGRALRASPRSSASSPPAYARLPHTSGEGAMVPAAKSVGRFRRPAAYEASWPPPTPHQDGCRPPSPFRRSLRSSTQISPPGRAWRFRSEPSSLPRSPRAGTHVELLGLGGLGGPTRPTSPPPAPRRRSGCARSGRRPRRVRQRLGDGDRRRAGIASDRRRSRPGNRGRSPTRGRAAAGPNLCSVRSTGRAGARFRLGSGRRRTLVRVPALPRYHARLSQSRARTAADASSTMAAPGSSARCTPRVLSLVRLAGSRRQRPASEESNGAGDLRHRLTARRGFRCCGSPTSEARDNSNE